MNKELKNFLIDIIKKNNEQNATINKVIGILEQEENKILDNRNKLQIINFNELSQKLGHIQNDENLINQGEYDNMKYVTKRKDGRYMIRLTMNGKRISRYANSIKDAQLVLSEMKKQKKFNSSEYIQTHFTLEQWTNKYMLDYKKNNVSERTYNDTLNLFKLINKQYGRIQLNKITTILLQEFFNRMAKTRSKENLQIYLNACLETAANLGYIKLNPMKAVKKEKRRKNKNPGFNYIEQVKILEALRGVDIEKEIYIYLMCGCRPNELPPNSNFDFENNFIVINGTKNKNAEERLVDMSEEFKQYIMPYIQKGQRLKEKYISKKFKAICLSIGIENPLLYRLRHTFATNHFTLGTNAKLVQSWMGHGSVSLTLDVYTDIDRRSSKEKIIKLYNNFYFTNT